jgi:ketosteroid isomerase-like protein
MKTLLLALFLLCTHFTFAQTQNEEEVIRKNRKASNDAIARRDLEGICKFLLDDFVIIRGSGVVEIGKARNTETWKKMIEETPQTYFERLPSEIIISKNNPNLAWESGTWKGFNTYSKGGRYSAQWKKNEGEWKLQAELFVALE